MTTLSGAMDPLRTIAFSLLGLWCFLAALPDADSLALSHWDLESANETCDGKSTCRSEPQAPRAGFKSRLEMTLDWRDRNCLCDKLCATYGDCCVDSPFFVSSLEQRRGAVNFECVDLRQFGGIYMVGSCPPDFDGMAARERCEGTARADADREHADVCARCKLLDVSVSLEECDRCESPRDDPVANLPVTSHKTGLTYRNAFCALCHGDFDDASAELWAPRLECPSLLLSGNLSQDVVDDKLVFSQKMNTWGLNLTSVETTHRDMRLRRTQRDLVASNFRARKMKDVMPATQFKESTPDDLNGHSRPTGVEGRPHNTFFSCHIDPVIPETVAHVVRRCQTDVVKACATNWTNVEIRSRCEAYTSTVYQGSIAYRNPHCALCNNVPIQYLSCTKTASHRSIFNKDFSPAAFSVLFDFRGKGAASSSGVGVGKKKACRGKELYDPFFKVCRNVFDADEGLGAEVEKEDVELKLQEEISNELGQIYHLKDNYKNLENGTNHSSNYSKLFLSCGKVILDSDDYSMEDDNETIYIEKYKKKYERGEYRIIDSGLLEICAEFGVEYVDKFGAYMGYVTFVGLGVSIAFLVLHLVAFAVVKDLRNLSGKNLASFCLSLLCAYTAFLVGQLPVDASACKFLGFFTFYSFLASFFWMLTISFDIFRTLKLATCELRVSLGSQRKKFIAYSAFAWLTPLIILCTSIALEYTDNPYQPGFGMPSCWFSNKLGLLIFFVGPIGVIMALNVIFFSSSAHMIYTTRHSTLSRSISPTTSRTRRDFKLYIRLCLVMGLTWIIGLIAGFLDIEVLWYIFIGLNTLQGLFIFLAFTCNEKVVRGVKQMVRPASRGSSIADRAKRGPPSFSWSGASSLTPHSDETRKTEISTANPDTLY